MAGTLNADQINWNDVAEDMARHIAQQGEMFLQAQLQISLASDQRAVTAASVFATFATAVLGVTLAYWDTDIPLMLAGLTASAAMGTGAMLGFWSARPITVYVPGNHPEQWWSCRDAGMAEALGMESENYQNRIEHNARCLESNGKIFFRGMVVAVSAPLSAFAVWGGAAYLEWVFVTFPYPL